LFIALSQSSPDPLYKQITDQIRDAIATGELGAEERLPSIRDLARSLNTSVITVKRAYQDLESLGYIFSRAGLGSFVKTVDRDGLRVEKLQELRTEFGGVLQAVRKFGISKEDIVDLINGIEED
jgi:GntR family transcriptional regulator